MTTEDRVRAVAVYIAAWRDPFVEEIAAVIAEAIQEERKAAIEEEREACAKIADAEEGHCQKGQAHGGIGSEMYVYHRAAGKAAKRIAGEIRARSVNPP